MYQQASSSLHAKVATVNIGFIKGSLVMGLW